MGQQAKGAWQGRALNFKPCPEAARASNVECDSIMRRYCSSCWVLALAVPISLSICLSLSIYSPISLALISLWLYLSLFLSAPLAAICSYFVLLIERAKHFVNVFIMLHMWQGKARGIGRRGVEQGWGKRQTLITPRPQLNKLLSHLLFKCFYAGRVCVCLCVYVCIIWCCICLCMCVCA